MRRFFVSPHVLVDDCFDIGGDLYNHLVRVLRLSPGDDIELLDGQGLCCLCRIEALTKKVVQLRVITRNQEQEQVFPVRLMQGLPKGEKMDLILQKGTELGITRFTPLLSGRSVPQLDATRRDHRRQRWLKIVEEAARQCRRPLLPLIDDPVAYEDALAAEGELKLLLWEERCSPLAQALPAAVPCSAVVLVGPEGGLTEAEVAQAQSAGFVPVSLGPRILRTETAGFTVAAILQYLYGDLGAVRVGTMV